MNGLTDAEWNEVCRAAGPDHSEHDCDALKVAVERILAARGEALAGKVRALADEIGAHKDRAARWAAETDTSFREAMSRKVAYEWCERELRALLDAAETTGETPSQACEDARGGDFGGAVDQGADDENLGDV